MRQRNAQSSIPGFSKEKAMSEALLAVAYAMLALHYLHQAVLTFIK